MQHEQHEEAQPKKKAKGLDLVSGGANCKQTSAVLCDLWHNSQVFNAQAREALGRNAAQAVTDSVKRFAKNGFDAPMEEWKKCKTWEAKREFALKLATDKTASFIHVTQTEALKSQTEVSDVTGWLHIWEIADVEKFPYRTSDPDMMAKLMRFVSDCPSRPSEKPELAADGELQYGYRKKQVTKHSVVRSSDVAAKFETTTDEQGFHEAKDAINAEAHAMPMSTKTKSKTSRSSTSAWFSARRQGRQSASEESALDESCERNEDDRELSMISKRSVRLQVLHHQDEGEWQGAGDVEDQDRERACQR